MGTMPKIGGCSSLVTMPKIGGMPMSVESRRFAALTWDWRQMLDDAIYNMSSTLKKRRAKMNKHKLRKRRKLERRKSK